MEKLELISTSAGITTFRSIHRLLSFSDALGFSSIQCELQSEQFYFEVLGVLSHLKIHLTSCFLTCPFV